MLLIRQVCSPSEHVNDLLEKEREKIGEGVRKSSRAKHQREHKKVGWNRKRMVQNDEWEFAPNITSSIVRCPKQVWRPYQPLPWEMDDGWSLGPRDQRADAILTKPSLMDRNIQLSPACNCGFRRMYTMASQGCSHKSGEESTLSKSRLLCFFLSNPFALRLLLLTARNPSRVEEMHETRGDNVHAKQQWTRRVAQEWVAVQYALFTGRRLHIASFRRIAPTVMDNVVYGPLIASAEVRQGNTLRNHSMQL